MISIRKLAALPPSTRRRKIVRLLESWIVSGQLPPPRYVEGVCGLLAGDADLSSSVREAAGRTIRDIRGADDLRHHVLLALDMAPGDWDLLSPAGLPASRLEPEPGEAPAGRRPACAPLPVVAYLDSVRSPFNAGSVIRSAAAFGIRGVVLSPECPPLDHRRLLRSAMGAESMLELSSAPLGEILAPDDAVVALELGGTALPEFRFPARGVLLVGSEELGIRPDYLRRADARVSIPMSGVKSSLNLAVACGIALHAWTAQLRRPSDTAGADTR